MNGTECGKFIKFSYSVQNWRWIFKNHRTEQMRWLFIFIFILFLFFFSFLLFVGLLLRFFSFALNYCTYNIQFWYGSLAWKKMYKIRKTKSVLGAHRGDKTRPLSFKTRPIVAMSDEMENKLIRNESCCNFFIKWVQCYHILQISVKMRNIFVTHIAR